MLLDGAACVRASMENAGVGALGWTTRASLTRCVAPKPGGVRGPNQPRRSLCGHRIRALLTPAPIISDWHIDELGNPTRFVVGVCARRFKELIAAGQRRRTKSRPSFSAELLEHAA